MMVYREKLQVNKDIKSTKLFLLIYLIASRSLENHNMSHSISERNGGHGVVGKHGSCLYALSSTFNKHSHQRPRCMQLGGSPYSN